jgi:aspartate racemase
MGEHRHPQITMHTHCLADYMVHVRAGEWTAVADLMLDSAEKLARTGADFLICPDNTIHQAFPRFAGRSPRPWLHIADEVASEAARAGFQRLGVLGTRSLMESPVYPDAFAKRGLEVVIPEDPDREVVDRTIFDELVKGLFTPAARARFSVIIDRLASEGCDAIVMGCTEIPLLLYAQDSSLPLLDSTRILARAALARAVGEGDGP